MIAKLKAFDTDAELHSCINLPNVTLCCVDTYLPDLSLQAIYRSIEHIKFGDVVFFTNITKVDADAVKPPIRIIDIPDIVGVENYSLFMLQSLAEHINTSHLLVIQWDGYVTTPSAWTDDFLAYDYIGATWPSVDGHPGQVGNGGFSLRSKKLLQALTSESIRHHHPEDDCIAKTHRTVLEQQFGIRFAAPDLADRFSTEYESSVGPTLGFHGIDYLPRVLSVKELKDFIPKAPLSTVFNGYFMGFLDNLALEHGNESDIQEAYDTVTEMIIRATAQATEKQLHEAKPLIKILLRLNLAKAAQAITIRRLKVTGYTINNLKLMAKALAKRLTHRYHTCSTQEH